MKWMTALLIGAILGFVLPLMFGGRAGVWMDAWTKYGTIAPVDGSPGLLFSIPFAIGSAVALRLFFDWHSG